MTDQELNDRIRKVILMVQYAKEHHDDDSECFSDLDQIENALVTILFPKWRYETVE